MRAATLLLLAATTALAHPAYNIAVDEQGNVYFLDWPTKRVMKAAPNGKLRVLAELAPHAKGTDPHTLAFDAAGDLVVGATYQSRAWRVSPAGKVSELPIAQRVGGAIVMVLGTANADLFVVAHDKRYWRVLKLPETGKTRELFRCDREGRNLYNGGMGVTPDGVVYLAAENRVVRVDQGKATPVAGSSDAGFLDGHAKSARFDTPWGLWCRADGTVLVADHGNHRIRVIAGDRVKTLAGDGRRGGRDGAAAQARFDSPHAVCARGGAVYVSEYPRATIRIRVIRRGVVSTLATLETR